MSNGLACRLIYEENETIYTPSCQLRLKTRVDLGDQTAEFIPFEVISTAILTYFTYFWVRMYAFWLARSTHAFNRMRQDGVHYLSKLRPKNQLADIRISASGYR